MWFHAFFSNWPAGHDLLLGWPQIWIVWSRLQEVWATTAAKWVQRSPISQTYSNQILLGWGYSNQKDLLWWQSFFRCLRRWWYLDLGQQSTWTVWVRFRRKRESIDHWKTRVSLLHSICYSDERMLRRWTRPRRKMLMWNSSSNSCWIGS